METLERLTLLLYALYEGASMLGALGHTHSQKMVYLLQQVSKIPFGYQFRMHYYGPFSEQLREDLFTLKDWGLLDIRMEIYPAGYFGYKISLSSEGRKFLETPDSMTLVRPTKEKILTVLQTLKGKQARDLELMGTVHFVSHLLGGASGKQDDQVVAAVRKLKPQFPSEEVLGTLQMLREENLLG